MVNLKIIENREVFDSKTVANTLISSANLKKKIAEDTELCWTVAKAAESIAYSIDNGGKVLVCGNGGSASDALHFCGELVGRFQKERKAVPAISLNADVATMTAVANDYGYEHIFARGVEAFIREEDIFIGISTSGNSVNVLNAVRTAKKNGSVTIALLGNNGGALKQEVDLPIVVPSNITARIQECHICIIHVICDMVERILN